MNFYTPTIILGWIDDNYSCTTKIIDLQQLNIYIQKTFLTKKFSIDIFTDEIITDNNNIKHHNIFYGYELPIYNMNFSSMDTIIISNDIQLKVEAVYMAYCNHNNITFDANNINIFNVIKTNNFNLFNIHPKYDILE